MRVALAMLVVMAVPAFSAGVEPVARVTTDSLEYCAELALRFSALPGAGEEPARSLAAEGTRLCEKGHPRAGVAKLRRAIRAARAEE